MKQHPVTVNGNRLAFALTHCPHQALRLWLYLHTILNPNHQDITVSVATLAAWINDSELVVYQLLGRLIALDFIEVTPTLTSERLSIHLMQSTSTHLPAPEHLPGVP